MFEDQMLMILPADNPEDIRLLRVPNDFESHEAYRHVTDLIATAEEEDPNCDQDDILAVLEDHGFEVLEYILGPALP